MDKDVMTSRQNWRRKILKSVHGKQVSTGDRAKITGAVRDQQERLLRPPGSQNRARG